MAESKIIVGMADLAVAKAPTIITTLGLGSCVGIALYDSTSKIAGLAHCMLPNSKQISTGAFNEAKFVDTATIQLLAQMIKLGARKSFIKAKIAGGAQMFTFVGTNEMMKIGDRNITATIKLLGELNIPIISKDTGLDYGRTVEINAETGMFTIKTIGHGNKII